MKTLEIDRMGGAILIITIVTLLLIIIATSAIVYDQTQIKEIEVEIIELTKQEIIVPSGEKSHKEEVKYFVVTDKGTFMIKNSLVNNIWNPDELFYNLKKGKYKMKIAGRGPSLILDYPIILSYESLSKR